jgi:hypothetical protein
VAPPTRVLVGDVGEHLELVGFDPTVRDLRAQHLVVATLTLAVDALVEAEDAERVVVDLAREVTGDAVLEAVELVLDDGVERERAQFGDVDHADSSRGTSPQKRASPDAKACPASEIMRRTLAKNDTRDTPAKELRGTEFGSAYAARPGAGRHNSSITSWGVRPIEMLGAPLARITK